MAIKQEYEELRTFDKGEELANCLVDTKIYYSKGFRKRLLEDIDRLKDCLGAFTEMNMTQNNNRWINTRAKTFANIAESRVTVLNRRLKDINRQFSLAELKSNRQLQKNENLLIKLVGDLAHSRANVVRRQLNEATLAKQQLEELKTQKIIEATEEDIREKHAKRRSVNMDIDDLISNVYSTKTESESSSKPIIDFDAPAPEINLDKE